MEYIRSTRSNIPVLSTNLLTKRKKKSFHLWSHQIINTALMTIIFTYEKAHTENQEQRKLHSYSRLDLISAAAAK